MARRRSKSRHWVDRQQRDPFVRGSQKEGYRSRAVYKLSEIDQKDRLIISGDVVLDLGAAPGGWSQYAATRVGVAGRVFAIDILPIAPIKGVVIVQGDLATESLPRELELRLKNEPIGLVLSDMAPNLTGIKAADQANSLGLARLALSVALKLLGPNGRFMVKVFEGAGTTDFRREMASSFDKVVVRKPQASRVESAEYYLLASRPAETR
ncbi:MAG TPA: RlmE family RNA methyltransferase [Gammaproteobacteria bacterium]|nr:RlmE family RNA methyltransferase [Gammaproteobacteria bacterium]